MSEALDFIAKYKLGYQTVRLEDLMDEYLAEMKRGLNGQESSLLMLPSYLVLKEEVQRNQKVVCVDAGGTNLRICVAHFDQSGAFQMDDIARRKMPGVDTEIPAQEFFDQLAEYIAPFCTQTKNIVISFAYRARITPEIDAEIIGITKEVKVKEATGKFLAKEIRSALAQKGIDDAHIIVLNDSVASALSGRAEYANQGYGAFTGTILGTGSNSCYPELNKNIGKLSGFDPHGIMVVNTEAGNFDKLPRSVLDDAYDKSTQFPGLGTAEKMSSGAYLGALSEFVLKQAAAENVFRTKAVVDIERLQTSDVSIFLENGSGVIAKYMLDETDEQNARELLQNIVLRTARLVALQMAAIAVKAHKQNNRICMSIEGTTYEKMVGLKYELKNTLQAYLQTQNIQADLVDIKNAVLKGCAIAGLSRL